MEQAAEKAVLFLCLPSSSKWRRPCRFVGILFSVVHFLFKLLGFLFVDKAETGEAVLELKGVEKRPVLVVAPVLKELLIPDDAAGGWLHLLATDELLSP